MSSVLAVLGHPVAYEAVVEWIRRRGQTVEIVMTAAEGIRAFQESGADCVLVGLPLEDESASVLLQALRRRDPNVRIAVVGIDRDIASAPDAFELGAQHYVDDPIASNKELLFTLGRALGARTGDTQLRFRQDKEAASADWRAVVGNSPAMQRVLVALRQVCQRTTIRAAPCVLLTGETGTGKGLIAKLFHFNSARREHGFVDINCAAIPAQLLESELFGHERGSFTDARSRKIGLFEAADGGTLLLDEIGTMPLDLQGKILTAIEDKQIRRIGGRQSMRVDVQIIAATHNDLVAMVKRNAFRADLFHRLNVVAIEMPPLRERGEDVIQIAEAVIASLAAEYGIPPPRLGDNARAAMLRYSWPGNVRELRNELERIMLLADDEVIRVEHFRFTTKSDANSITIHADATTPLQVTLTGDSLPLEDLEREVIRQALLRCNGNVSRTARYLAISRQTLIYRMRKYSFASQSNPGLYQFAEDEDAS